MSEDNTLSIHWVRPKHVSTLENCGYSCLTSNATVFLETPVKRTEIFNAQTQEMDINVESTLDHVSDSAEEKKIFNVQKKVRTTHVPFWKWSERQMTWKLLENTCVVELKKNDGCSLEEFHITDKAPSHHFVERRKNVRNGIFGIPCYEGFCVKSGKKTKLNVAFHGNERQGIENFVSALQKANIGIVGDCG